jgi:hypothetical protein
MKNIVAATIPTIDARELKGTGFALCQQPYQRAYK